MLRITEIEAGRDGSRRIIKVEGKPLVPKLRAGDANAWEDLVQQYGSRMYTIARRLLRTEHDSADAVQEAFLCFVRSLDSFEGNSRIWTWLYRILVNVCLGKLRSRS